MNTTEPPPITVPLGGEAHRLARQFAAQQATLQKGKQAYLNTLAVEAVHSYLKWLQIETLSQGDSWDISLRSLFNVADLVLPNIGKLGCCPLLPGETTCSLPSEVMEDRIGYIVVELDELLREATVLGFTPVTTVEQLAINQLQSIDQFIDYLGQLVQPVTASRSAAPSQTLVNLSQWLQNFFEAGWQSLEALLGTDPEVGFSFRSSLGSEANVTGAKLLNLGLQLESQLVMLLVALIQAEQEVGILVQVHPVGRDYLPPHLRLGLLAESGETLQQVQARSQDDYIQLKGFQGLPGECFVIQVAYEDASVTETFVI